MSVSPWASFSSRTVPTSRRFPRWRLVVAGLVLQLASPWLPGAQALPELSLETVASGLNAPVAITHAGDDRLFITLQGGRIVILQDGQVLPQPFLDIDDRVGSGGERGLLSVAFHPSYASNGFFFVYYTSNQGNSVIARYSVTANPNVASAGSEVILMTFDQPFSNHNGGQMQFGPDGLLYIATGDGGSGNDPDCLAQNSQSLLGKILRIDVNRTTAPFFNIPGSNPFVGVAGTRDEIWALGLRNPWRFSFDRATGDMFIGDVGQSSREEISFQPAGSGGGENYGWKLMEGSLCTNNSSGCASPPPACNSPLYTNPILEYANSGPDCAVTGGYIYRGSSIAGLSGYYFYGDFCSGKLWAARRSGASWTSEQLPFTAPSLSTFGEDSSGEIYLASNGNIFRLLGPAPAQAGSLQFTSSTAEAMENAGQIVLGVQRTGGSDGAVSVTYATANGSATAANDYTAASGTLEWADGDSTSKSLVVELIDDQEIEPTESFSVNLSAPTGGAGLGNRTSAQVTITDDDVDLEPCVADRNTLCLTGERFKVQVNWRSALDETGLGVADTVSEDAGFFWFFSPNNPEVFIKVLDACDLESNHFWVFAAGLTDVETSLTVVDTATGQVRRYDKPLGAGFDPIRDTSAFDTCP